MTIDHEMEAMSTIAESLSKVEDEAARQRILNWARDRFLPKGAKDRDIRSSGASDHSEPEEVIEEFGKKAARWIRQAALTSEQIGQVFHVDGKEVSVIAPSIPGRNIGERVVNCYLLEGIRSLLSTDEPTIIDDQARELCRTAGFYDVTNHSKRVATFGNRITGNAKRGWELTGPGLSAAAALIKEIATA